MRAIRDCEERSSEVTIFVRNKINVLGNTVYETIIYKMIYRCSKGDSNELEEMDCDSNAACSDHMAIRF